jgi:eukaryotic-like serine/threonine-protein kinase
MTSFLAADAHAPRTVGPYQVRYELGRGGMGVVYRATRIGGGPEVALKMPFVEMADYFGLLRREIHALGRLRHPGVVRIIEEGVDKGVPWYAMELLDSRTLDELLHIGSGARDPTMALPFEPTAGTPAEVTAFTRGRPRVRGDLHRALTLMYRLARVLAYVHAHGIVHRDLKPQNILVRRGDRPVLTDFGVMGHFRAQSGREVLEVGGMMMGTAFYAAPEQCSGELVDARADLYSFGVMLYEIVTGQLPFDHQSVNAVMAAHLSEAVRPPSQLVREVPHALERLILNLLEKERGDRLGYAEDVAALLVEAGAEPDPDFEIESAAYLYRPELVGRTATLSVLGERIPAVKKGEGAIVVIGGESGIGKTSVAAAFSREATVRRLRVITGEGDPVGAQPLHPLRPLLREIADSCRASGEILERVLGPRLAVLREHDATLAALADENAPRVAPAIASRRLFSDLAETLAAFAREGPLLLILDDLQWADELTLRFLTTLDEDFFGNLPLLILGTYRADEVGPDLRALLSKSHLKQIMLGRLDAGSVAEIAQSMLAAPDAPETFLQFLAKESEGNPFFVAEYLRTAVAERLLRREGGRWRVAATDDAYAGLGLPSTLRDLVRRRLDGLSPLARRIAETTAVLGREVPASLLAAVCGESEDDLLEVMLELAEHHVLDHVENGVRFAHDKLREGAYERIDPDRRRQLHGRAAEVLRTTYATDEQLDVHAVELARHYDEAGVEDEAIAYYSRAAEAALRTGACRETIHLMNRAFTLDERSPSGSVAERKLCHARWHRILCYAQYGIGDLNECGDHARMSLREVGVKLPQTQRGWRARLLFEALRQGLHLVLPRPWYRAHSTKERALMEVVFSALKYSQRSYYTGEREYMLTGALMAINTAERLGEMPAVMRAYTNLASTLSPLGLPRLAERYFTEARRLAIAANDLDAIAHVGFASGAHYTAICDWERLDLYIHDAVAAARMSGDVYLTEYSLTARGHFEMYTGQFEKSDATYAEVQQSARKRSDPQHECWGWMGRARALIPLGRLEEAREYALAGLKLREGQNDHLDEIVSQSLVTLALHHMGKRDEARAAADLSHDKALKNKLWLWEMFRGLAAPAEVYLDVWSRVRDTDAREAGEMHARVRRLLRTLRSLARRAPLARPASLRLTGVMECLKGNLDRGEELLRKSAAEAARLGLILDEGIAYYELERRSPSRREKNAARERAMSIFDLIRCDLYLRKMSEGA